MNWGVSFIKVSKLFFLSLTVAQYSMAFQIPKMSLVFVNRQCKLEKPQSEFKRNARNNYWNPHSKIVRHFFRARNFATFYRFYRTSISQLARRVRKVKIFGGKKVKRIIIRARNQTQGWHNDCKDKILTSKSNNFETNSIRI